MIIHVFSKEQFLDLLQLAFGAGYYFLARGRELPMRYRKFSSIWPLLTRCQEHPQMWQPKMSPDLAKCSLGANHSLEPLLYNSQIFTCLAGLQ